MKMKSLISALAATAFFVNGANAQSLQNNCQLGGVDTEGDATIASITSTGSDLVPCRLDLLLNPQAASRGRTNYSNQETGGGNRAEHDLISGGTLRISGIAQLPSDAERHKSSIFSMELEPNPAQSQLRVAIVFSRGAASLEVTQLNQWTGEVENLGSMPIARRGGFDLALVQSPRIAGLKLTLTSGAQSTTFTIDQNLGPKGLRGWRYGLLNDTSADNLVPYTWLMGHGPKPTITAN